MTLPLESGYRRASAHGGRRANFMRPPIPGNERARGTGKLYKPYYGRGGLRPGLIQLSGLPAAPRAGAFLNKSTFAYI